MPVSVPTPDQLKVIATEIGLALTDTDIDSFIALNAAFFVNAAIRHVKDGEFPVRCRVLRRRVHVDRPGLAEHPARQPQVHAGQPGYHVVTPLKLAGGSYVLVDRGWVAPASGGALAAIAGTVPARVATNPSESICHFS